MCGVMISTALAHTTEDPYYIKIHLNSTYGGNFILMTGLAHSQQHNVTFASSPSFIVRKAGYETKGTLWAGGSNPFGYHPNDGDAATSGSFASIYNIAVDENLNVFAGEIALNKIRKVDTNGILSTAAGGAMFTPNYGDGGPATSSTVVYPMGLQFSSDFQKFYFSNFGDDTTPERIARIRQIDTNNIISSLILSDPTFRDTGDLGSYTSATIGLSKSIYAPNPLVIFSTHRCHVREINLDTGVIRTLIGSVCVSSGEADADDMTKWEGSGDRVAGTAAIIENPTVTGKFLF